MNTPRNNDSTERRRYRPGKVGNTTIGIGADIGSQRTTQQDAYETLDLSETSNNGFLLIVADGMGGEQGGEIASQFLTQSFKDSYTANRQRTNNALQAMEACIIQANQRILEDAEAFDRKGMGTTAVALAYEDDVAYVAHVGDSRAYIIDDQGFRQITVDHTRVQRLISEGIISPQEAENHPDAHVLSQAVGRKHMQVDLNNGTAFPTHNALFMLCSDGLTGMLPDSVIESALRAFEPFDAFERLMDLANDLDASDNITIAIASNRKLERAYSKAFHTERKALLAGESLPSSAVLPVQSGPQTLIRRLKEAPLVHQIGVGVFSSIFVITLALAFRSGGTPQADVTPPERPEVPLDSSITADIDVPTEQAADDEPQAAATPDTVNSPEDTGADPGDDTGGNTGDDAAEDTPEIDGTAETVTPTTRPTLGTTTDKPSEAPSANAPPADAPSRRRGDPSTGEPE